MPVSLVLGRSKTRKAARLAVYDATIIIANPAHTIPSTRAEKLRGVPVKLVDTHTIAISVFNSIIISINYSICRV